jgi:hypothetical protein
VSTSVMLGLVEERTDGRCTLFHCPSKPSPEQWHDDLDGPSGARVNGQLQASRRSVILWS